MRTRVPSTECGSMDLGSVFMYVAVMGTAVLIYMWGSLPIWGRTFWIVALSILAVLWFVSLGAPSGLGENALREEKRKRREGN